MARAKYLTDPDTFNREYQRLVSMRGELKSRIDETNELIRTLKESESVPQEAQEKLDNLKSESARLENLLETTQSYAGSIEEFYKDWTATKTKIDTQLANAKDKNQTLSGYLKEGETLKAKLDGELERSDGLLADARKTLELITDSSLSSAFKQRSNDRKKARRLWTGAVVLAVALFAGSVVFAITQLAPTVQGFEELNIWILRLAVVVPFAYILFFVTRQYSHERDLEEKYAFKSLVSQTLRNNTKLLNDEFSQGEPNPNVQAKILDFTIESMKGVYKEPYKSSSMESRLKLNPFKKNIEAEAKVKESE